ncbi:MAG: O-antigen ligase family protein, partial [Deltaproteobacteria bacterium]|nr:O-antigen ligase family protein [Deltaproteobacteria bacterium]
RSVYLGFAITLIALLTVYRVSFSKLKLLAFPVAICLVFMSFNIQVLMSADRRQGGVLQTKEVADRLSLINMSLLMFFDHPIFGVGEGQFFPAAMEKYRGKVPFPEGSTVFTQHNHFLGLLVELGITGTAVYVAIIFTLFKRLYRLVEFLPETRFLGYNFLLILATGMIVYLNNNLFVEPSYFLFGNSVFFTFGGMIDGLHRKYVTAA